MSKKIKIGMLVRTDHSQIVYEVVAIRFKAQGAVLFKLDKATGWWSAWQLSVIF